jgi:small subunit ribosomal protein S16
MQFKRGHVAPQRECQMLSIRMRRTGSKKRPFFRVVVSEARSKKEGQYIEVLGFYNPRTKPAVVEINKERITYWISKGARPSDSVRTLLSKHLTRDRAIVETPVTAEPTAPTA